MITAVDSSVLLDVLVDAQEFAARSEAALRAATAAGALIVGECALAEIRPALTAAQIDEFLLDWNIDFVPSSRASSLLAGEMYARYLVRRPARSGRVVADFLIGAHAKLHADRLLARDRGYYRDYFKGLRLIEP